MSTKNFGPSRGADSVGNRLAGRYTEASHTSAESAPSASAPSPRMVTRSWYLPAETADRLGQVADQLWRAVPGTSKHQVLAALIEAGLDQAETVRAQLDHNTPT